MAKLSTKPLEITINTSRGEFTVRWEHPFSWALKRFAFYQNGRFMDFQSLEEIDDAEFVRRYTSIIQERWNRLEGMADLGSMKSPTIINVGAGVGTIDLIMAQFFEGKSLQVLVDRETQTPHAGSYYAESGDAHGFYNSWEPLNSIRDTRVQLRDQIFLFSPEALWPYADLVYSSYSWCWHYPRHVYWDRAMHSLSKGGTLMLDVLDVSGAVPEITAELGSEPIEQRYKLHPNSGVLKQFEIKTDSHGGCYCWKKAQR